jgi:predicted dehydrogenase
MSLSVAIVGAGRMGRTHVKGLESVRDATITGIADVRLDAAESLAGPVGAKAFTDYREMLTILKPDAVYFCTPSSDHLEQVAFAADAGVNVFVEKPIAANVTDAMAIADAVGRAGILCTTGYQWRYNPATDAAREALGDLPVSLFSGWWYWTIPVIPWIADKRYGGGQIFDQCTHLIDLMRYLAGDITSVYARYAKNARTEEELPNWDSYSLTLDFANGGVGSVQSSYATFPGIPESNGLDAIARELLVRIRLGHTTIFRRDSEPVETHAPAGWSIDQPFMEAVRRNDPSRIRSTAREAALSIAVSLASNHSATTGKVIDLADFVANPPPAEGIMPNAQPAFA